MIPGRLSGAQKSISPGHHSVGQHAAFSLSARMVITTLGVVREARIESKNQDAHISPTRPNLTEKHAECYFNRLERETSLGQVCRVQGDYVADFQNTRV